MKFLVFTLFLVCSAFSFASGECGLAKTACLKSVKAATHIFQPGRRRVIKACKAMYKVCKKAEALSLEETYTEDDAAVVDEVSNILGVDDSLI